MNAFQALIASALQSDGDVAISSPIPTPHAGTQIYSSTSTTSIGTSNQGVPPTVALALVQKEGSLLQEMSPVASAEANQSVQGKKNPSEVLPPQGDFISSLKDETTWNNAISGNIESRKRLYRHQVEAYDEQALNNLLAELSMRPMLKLRGSISSCVEPPVTLLPPEAEELVRQLSGGDLGRLQVACACLLGMTFAAARGNWTLKDHRGFRQLVTDYMIVSAPSGWGKSTMLGDLAKPFSEFELRLQQGHQLSRRASNPAATLLALRGVEQSLLAQIRKRCRETGDPDAAVEAFQAQLAEVLEQKSQLEAEVHAVPRLLLDRVTLEQLPHEMAAQGDVAAIFGDEGGILRQIRPSNADIFVKGATGESFSTSTRGSGMVAIAHPCLAVLLLVQPSKLDLLFGNEDLVDYGVAARFLPVLSHIAPGGIAKPDQVVDGRWLRQKIHTILEKRERIRIGVETRPRYTLELDPDATVAVDAFSRQLKEEMDSSSKAMRHFLDRLPWHAKNLAGALHLLKYAVPDERAIDIETMKGGIAFAEFFRQHAEAAYDPSARDGVIFAPKILRWIKRDRPMRFTDRDAHRGVGSGRCTVAQVRAGLDELERANYVRRYLTGSGKMLYLVHPAAYSM